MTRDLRRFARQTSFRLILGGLVLIFVVGDGLVYWVYGPGAAAMGLVCLVAGLTPILLILLFLGIVDWITKRANRE
jgi:hypothetical protein